MATIRRNWTKRVDAIRAAAKHCRAYDSSTGHMITVDPARAFEAWQANKHATLREDTPGQKWGVHVHSNKFYVLTASDPEQNRQERPQATAAPVPAAAAPTAPVRSADEDAVLQNVREYITDAPGIGANTAAAATAVVGQKIQAGAIARDRLTGALPSITAAVTAKAVADMRAQGLTHEQIRQRLDRKRAEAVHAGNTARVTVVDAMIAAHTGIVADEAQARAAATVRQLNPAEGRNAIGPAAEREAAAVTEDVIPEPEPEPAAPGQHATGHLSRHTPADHLAVLQEELAAAGITLGPVKPGTRATRTVDHGGMQWEVICVGHGYWCLRGPGLEYGVCMDAAEVAEHIAAAMGEGEPGIPGPATWHGVPVPDHIAAAWDSPLAAAWREGADAALAEAPATD